ncbi:MAG TPA: hypothetical protein VLD65_04855 [Anaerolineales bacterium]|nr:hypothetical protein [Anaerolineales bacterium]
MYTFDYLAWSINQKHEELLRQADEYRKLNKALRTEKPINKGKSRFWLLVGKELANVGFSLEMRYGGLPETWPTLEQQSDLGGRS